MELASKDARSYTRLAQRAIMKFLLSDGERFREKVARFPPANKLASSRLLVVCVENDGYPLLSIIYINCQNNYQASRKTILVRRV